MKHTLVILFILIKTEHLLGVIRSLKPVAQWKDLDFQFPTTQMRQTAIRQGLFVKGNGVPIDMDVNYKDDGLSRVFVTIPRFSTGIPITLGVVTGTYENGNPLIVSYPDYRSQNNNCDGLTSVFRVAIDECQRLWVLDSGRIGDIQNCPPQLLVYNLNTDKILHRYIFPRSQYKPEVSLLITPIIDVRDTTGSCINTMVYIADVNSFGLLVYDLYKNKSWRIVNKFMYPNPNYGTFTIAGESFDLMDGMFGLALTPRYYDLNTGRSFNRYGAAANHLTPTPSQNYNRKLYFHPLASIGEYAVPLRLIDNSTIWDLNPESYPNEFKQIGTRMTQSGAQAMDSNGNLYFGLMSTIAIGCWDTNKDYTTENMRIVAHDVNTLQFISGLKVVMNKKGKEELWVLSCRFQKIANGSKKSYETNFRIQALQIDELLGGSTKCSSAGLPISNIVFPRN